MLIFLSSILTLLIGIIVTYIYLNKKYSIYKEKNIKLNVENIQLKNSIKDQEERYKKDTKNLEYKFENFVNKLLNDSSEKLQKKSEKSISDILIPLKEKIDQFQEKYKEDYKKEAVERAELKTSLKAEIEKIINASNNMQENTINLTKALRGSVKTQGNWGEVVLENILKSSGLREGVEYITQGKSLKLKNESGKHLKPDIIVKLPDDKHIVIDSKVSLIHYENYINSEDSYEKKESINSFIKSIDNHIKDLESKSYHLQEKLITSEFTLMFFPIEGAFSLALQNKQDIFTRAWEKSIIIVSPTTLLATLRTIASIWKQEKQNKNAFEIASESGKLYDKFVNFINDLDKIGEQLGKAKHSHENAIKKLHHGPGNIISKIEKLKTLGAKNSKELLENGNIKQ